MDFGIYKKNSWKQKKASQGDNYFTAENPPFGVEFTYYLNKKYLSKKELRLSKEKKFKKKNKTLSVPEWEILDQEYQELGPENMAVYLFR